MLSIIVRTKDMRKCAGNRQTPALVGGPECEHSLSGFNEWLKYEGSDSEGASVDDKLERSEKLFYLQGSVEG